MGRCPPHLRDISEVLKPHLEFSQELSCHSPWPGLAQREPGSEENQRGSLASNELIAKKESPVQQLVCEHGALPWAAPPAAGDATRESSSQSQRRPAPSACLGRPKSHTSPSIPPGTTLPYILEDTVLVGS